MGSFYFAIFEWGCLISLTTGWIIASFWRRERFIYIFTYLLPKNVEYDVTEDNWGQSFVDDLKIHIYDDHHLPDQHLYTFY